MNLKSKTIRVPKVRLTPEYEKELLSGMEEMGYHLFERHEICDKKCPSCGTVVLVFKKMER